MNRRAYGVAVWAISLACWAGAANAIPVPQPELPEGRWFATQLHCHTRHSDGYHGVEDLIRWARSAGLDALAITDHQTNKHLEDTAYRSSEDLVLIPGYEWGPGFAVAKAHGERCHASLWGTRVGLPAIDVMLPHDQMLKQAADQGLTVGVNHPFEPRFPWPDEDFSQIHAMEVWQWQFHASENSGQALPDDARVPRHSWSDFLVRNSRSLDLWQRLLRRGQRVTPVATADFHVIIQQLESPCTLIWSREATVEALLASLRAGHVALVERPHATRVEVWADGDGDGMFEAMAGDEVPDGARVQVRVFGGRGLTLAIADTTGPLSSLAVTTDPCRVEVKGAKGFCWARLDRGGFNSLKAMSGALFIE